MDIKNRIGLQSCKYNSLLLEEEVEFCINYGFKVFEVFFDDFIPGDIMGDLRKWIKEISAEKGLTLQVHAPICKRENWQEVLKETVIFTSEIGSKILTFHPEKGDIPLYKDVFDLALGKGIDIGFENYKESGNYYKPEELKYIAGQFSGYPNMGITFDTGHANIGTKPHEYLKAIAGDLKIFNVHLHDNMGKTDNHLPLGQGNINFSELIVMLDEIDYRGNFIIEHWDGNMESARYFYTLYKYLIP